ncbi:type ISP restriction/modification enzyme [Anaerobiospirillum thomasii]|uniref:site-specific DNA-methyltransferase (adenine-specific) n=1 Tax=Anaerobiospirillum thomasii TaxID=179995 RepID=A0A2X0WX95_9GAMM|nr:type ISP restriction/modification enzyme [Anaerobiospirillum thomasii]SPT70141.1 Predicted helicase [Anaerobiospirillum thomasii]
MNKSVDDLLQKEFNKSISDKDLHILDPFTGTGSFIVRLMQSGLIDKDSLKYKYEHDLHANELVPLAYYIAAMNIETAYHELIDDAEYKPNDIMVWTDTFADNKASDIFTTSLRDNNAKQVLENNVNIKVIIGNPPYSVGQESQNDDNANEHYEILDKRLQETYVDRSNATLKGKLFDSYIRAYRWASDRIGDSGIVAFITNAGWIESSSADGMRKCLAEEFSSIYVYHLKGNARTSGEQRRKEKDNVFGEGSRSPVAIVFLVKNPEAKERGKIYFNTVADYLTRDQKLSEVCNYGSVKNMSWSEINPDSHGDWLNQRDDSFSKFIRLDGKKTDEISLFKNFSLGVVTSRDTWVYNSSVTTLEKNVNQLISFYNQEVDRAKEEGETYSPNMDPTKINWDRPQKRNVVKGIYSEQIDTKKIYCSLYRPFFKQNIYFDRYWNNCVYQLPVLFPHSNTKNLVIAVNQKGTEGVENISIMCDTLCDLHYNGDSQCFPRFIYETEENGYKKVDAITDVALEHFQRAYTEDGRSITKDDIFYYIYGILHSKEYREKYANNLGKELPRIPRVATYEQFKAFAEAGRALADLHVNYEKRKIPMTI